MIVQEGMLSGHLAKYTAEQVSNDFEVSLEPLKYEFTGETKELDCSGENDKIKLVVTYRRIRAIKDFADVKAGDVGGWIAEGALLDQAGDCWLYDDSELHSSAVVIGDVQIRGNSSISGRIQGSGTIHDSSIYKSVIYGKLDITNARLRNCRFYGTNITLLDSEISSAAFGRYRVPEGTITLKHFENDVPVKFANGTDIQNNEEFVFCKYRGDSYALYPTIEGINWFDNTGKLAKMTPAIVEPAQHVVENAVANRKTTNTDVTSYFD